MRYCHPATLVAALLIILVFPAVDSAAESTKKAASKNQPPQSVEFFSAIQAGQIDARITVTPTFQLQAVIFNQSNAPLNVELPENLPPSPCGVWRFEARRCSAGRSPPSPQGTPTYAVSSATNRMNMQTVGGGFWDPRPDVGPLVIALAPGKPQRVVVAVVCLEDGKNNPSVAMPYALVPVDSFAQRTEVGEVCQMLGHGMVNRRVAQLAAWHFNRQ